MVEVSSCEIPVISFVFHIPRLFPFSGITVVFFLLYHRTHLLHRVILIRKAYNLYFQFLNSQAPFKCPKLHFIINMFNISASTLSFYSLTYDSFLSPLQSGVTPRIKFTLVKLSDTSVFPNSNSSSPNIPAKQTTKI